MIWWLGGVDEEEEEDKDDENDENNIQIYCCDAAADVDVDNDSLL